MLRHDRGDRVCQIIFKLIHMRCALIQSGIFCPFSFQQVFIFEWSLRIWLSLKNFLLFFMRFLLLIIIELWNLYFKIAFQQKKFRVVFNFPVCSWQAISAAIPLTLITMPEKWMRFQIDVASIAKDIVFSKFITCKNSSGDLELM